MDIPKDEFENKKYRLTVVVKCEQDPEFRELVRLKCSKDFSFWVSTFAWTFNPRLESASIPFILYLFQENYVKGLLECIESGKDSFTEKSRDMGVSWMLVAVCLWHFLYKKSSALYGSYKEDYVDSMGNMDSFFERLRFMIKYIPKWMLPSDMVDKYMNISSKKLEAEIAGDTGQNFGRGGRRTFVILDEFSYWQYDQSAWRGTRDVTNCRIFAGCVTKDTIIIGKNGIEDIGESPDGYMKTKKEVYGKGGFHKVEQRYGNGFSNTIKINVTHGFELEGTPNHKVLTHFGFKRLDELKRGDVVYIQKDQNVFGKIDNIDNFNNKFNVSSKINYGNYQKKELILNKDLCYLVGLIFAEGCWDKNRVTITNNDKEIQDFLLRYGFKKQDKFHFRFGNTRLCSFLDWIGMPHGAKNKIFSKWMLQLKEEFLVELLKGYFDGDGSSQFNKSRISCISSSKKLIRQLQMLLLNFGIVSNYYEHLTPPTKKANVSSMGYRLEFCGYNAWVFYNKIGFRLIRKQNNIKSITDNMKKDWNLYYFDKNDFDGIGVGVSKKWTNKLSGHLLKKFLDKKPNEKYDIKLICAEVLNIEYSKNYCYDFVIPNTHQYFTNGFISHNTPNGAYNIYGRVMTGHKDYAHLNVKKFRLHWSDHPLKTKEWYENEKKRRTREDIARELDISYDDSVEGAVYKNFMQDCKFTKALEYNRELGDVYTSWDFGRDTTAILWFQKDLKTNTIYIFDSYQNQDKEIDFYMAFLKGKPTQGFKYTPEEILKIDEKFKIRNRITRNYGDPYNGKSKTVTSASSIADIFQSHGFYLDMKTGTTVEDRVDKTKLAMRRMIIKEELYEFIQAIIQSRYPAQKENSQNTRESTLPIHDSNSHFRTCLEYLCDNEEDIVPIAFHGSANSDFYEDEFEASRLFNRV